MNADAPPENISKHASDHNPPHAQWANLQRASLQWGGRFSEGPAAIMQAINASIGFDYRLWREDIQGSLAHASMLASQGIISQSDEAAISAGLTEIGDAIAAGTFTFDPALEDIHTNIEAWLVGRIGEAGRRLHTARSRNDQVATDFKLWVRNAIDATDIQLRDLMRALADRAAEHAGAIMPGFTHLQTAQPVTFGHHLLAYVEMLARDRSRLADCRRRLNESPLGAAALAGTTFPIDRAMTAHSLGFDRPTANSLDSVSDRDFAIEFLSTLSIMAMHLSRFAEEIIIWVSAPYRFIRLSDAFTTGSSIMPQDMQEDKEAVFNAADAAELSIAAMTGMVRDMQADEVRMREAAGADYATATDLADYLVRDLGLPFRTAHHVTGRIVAAAEARGIDLADLPLAVMQEAEPRITEAVFATLSIEASVAARSAYGGTAPANVAREAAQWQESLR
ncbi:argininosuccinate lyase [Acidiphilium sp. 34-64-41]|uniref:argininosuccinate lyase n=1 Tax=Acidiphilium sp. 34-64-41 TaxID=1970297 RepID=UPI000BCC1AAB|nr:argininosuccinate lyase [Acidiphilium sp. 34-64-41]OZB29384.1 MAG: argininosuccinate lyase [Acidiphilium sp. 34-64-41]